MRGGTLRMQAQYLRQVHIPKPADLTDAEHDVLVDAYRRNDRVAATKAVARLLGTRPGRVDK
jgi:adenine-specific DNA-methyltransferase